MVLLQIIVAVDEDELPRLEALYERGLKNQVKGLSMIEAEEIKHIEPLCKVSVHVLFVCSWLVSCVTL